MATSNPVSPKLVFGGIGAALGPILVTIVVAAIDAMNSGTLVLPEPWQTYVYWAASIIGAVAGAYFKTDGLRLPTLDAEKLRELPDGEARVVEAADKLNTPIP